MLKLSSNKNLNANVIATDQSSIIAKITTNPQTPMTVRDKRFLLVRDAIDSVPSGFAAIFYIKPAEVDGVELSKDLHYLDEGDIVKYQPETNFIRVYYRKNANINSFLVTERCNSFCLMCSQPPRDINDDYLVDDLIQVIKLIDRDEREIMISGGEPTLLGDRFIDLLWMIKNYLPDTAVHVLSNGRNFGRENLASEIARVGINDLMFGIPLYSDISSIHDFIVQAKGAYEETIKGIVALKECGVRVELRVVLHKQTVPRLLYLAEFIARNLTFVDQVALMGLEITGFTRANLEELWIDPFDYQETLKKAVYLLQRYKVRPLLFNLPYCLVPDEIKFAYVKSISDWKNEYLPECEGCLKMSDCGGFFSSAKIKHSEYITPYT